MTSFIVIAAAMVLAIAALLAVPLLSRRPPSPRAPRMALVVLIVLATGAAGLYATFSNWNWSSAKTATADASPQSMVATLARRLAKDPNDLNGWLLLGRSYSVLQETPLAVRAYEHANQLGKGENVDALLGLAEALVTEDDSQLAGRAGDLVDKALKLDPHSPRGLFYGAAAAIQRKQLPLARERFTALLAQNPPANVRPLIEQQIKAIDQALGAVAPAAASSDTGGGCRRGRQGACPGARIHIAVAPTLKTGQVKGDAPAI